MNTKSLRALLLALLIFGFAGAAQACTKQLLDASNWGNQISVRESCTGATTVYVYLQLSDNGDDTDTISYGAQDDQGGLVACYLSYAEPGQGWHYLGQYPPGYTITNAVPDGWYWLNQCTYQDFQDDATYFGVYGGIGSNPGAF